MNLKTRLFGKPWQHKDAAVRAQAVSEQMDDTELTDALPRLARDDESSAVRLAALKRINTEAAWLEARQREQDADILAAADRFIQREALRSDNPEFRPGRLRWLESLQAAETIRQLARSAPDLALRRAALARINAPGFLGDCYAEERDESLAAEILERIEQVSTLERMQERLRKTSKQRAQAVARRLANLRAAKGQADPDHQAAEGLVHQMENLARGKQRGERAQVHAELSAQWAEIREPDPALERRFRGAEAIVQSALNAPPAAARAAEPAVEASAEPAGNAELRQVAESIRERLRHARGKFEPGEVLAEWDRCWNRIGQVSEADQALKEEMLPILRELQAQVEFRARQRKDQETRADDQQADKEQLNRRIDQLAEKLEGGDIAKAHQMLAQLKTEFGKLPARARPQAIAGRLQRMDGRLKEKRDWQHWSNNKHRDELIEQVERLAGSGQHPDAITAALKDARAEWQRLEKLEIMPGERKRYAAPPGQWRRFQAACQQAFDQAKPYLEKRNEVQEDNLKTLSAFITLGKQQAADENSDSKLLLNTQRAARQAIRRLDDLPPRTRGRAAAQLRELMDQISKRLDDLFGQIEQTKRELIAEARKLSEESDLKVAIDKAKALQARWQQAGSGRRKIEQTLWQEFRAPIEPLFEQVKGEREAQKQAEKAELAELKAVCAEAEEIALSKAEDLDSARGRMAAVADKWHDLGRKPAPLKQRFDKAQATLRERIEQRARQAEIGARERIDKLAAAVQTLWQARQAGDSDLEKQLPNARDDDPAEAIQLIERARQIAAAGASEDLAGQAEANAQNARQIVVEMEFLSGLDTPEADQPLRMDFQVKRLARRMSEGDSLPALNDELEQLQARWREALPMPEADFARFEPRYRRAREVLLKMSGQ